MELDSIQIVILFAFTLELFFVYLGFIYIPRISIVIVSNQTVQLRLWPPIPTSPSALLQMQSSSAASAYYQKLLFPNEVMV